MARPSKCRHICSKPRFTSFLPEHCASTGTVTIGYDSYEVIRLLDNLLLTQEQCAEKMNISRTTVTRIYDHARRQIADALVNGKRIQISGGDVTVCTSMRPECKDQPHCCHRQAEIKGGII